MTPDNRPKPTPHQRKLYMGFINKLTELTEQESEFHWKEHPWLEDPTYPKPWDKPITTSQLEAEKKLVKKKISKITEEIDKLFKEMYPPHIYPEMHGQVEQPALVDGVEPQKFNTPSEEPKTVESMSMEELEGIFGARKSPPPIVAKTTAGAEILKQFEARRNRTKGY